LQIHRKLGIRSIETVRILTLLQRIHTFRQQHQPSEDAGREALAIANEQPVSVPEVPSILHRLATSVWYRGDLTQAEQLARQAVALHRQTHGDHHPQTAWSLHILGCILEELHRDDDAIACFREAMAIFWTQFDHSNRGWQYAVSHLTGVLNAQRKLAELDALRAEVAARAAHTVAQRPNDPVILLTAAEALRAVGEVDQAIDVLNNVMSMNAQLSPTESATARIHLGSALAEKNLWDQAAEQFAQALDDSVDASTAVESGYLLALARLQSDERDGYRHACATLVAVPDIGDVDSRNFLARACSFAPHALDDYSVPLRLAEANAAANPSNAGLRATLGAVLFRAGRYQPAAEQLRQAIDAFASAGPDSSEALFPKLTLAMVMWRQNQPDQARRMLSDSRSAVDDAIDSPFTAWSRKAALQSLHQEAQALIEPAASGTRR
jgi:tetratricopeptide (TPR) repeat protein